MADWSGYLAARDLAGQVGPWLIWPAVAAAWISAVLSFPAHDERRHRQAAWGTGACFFLLAGSCLLLVWYHWRIYVTLPLELPPESGAWLNRQLAAMGRKAGGLGPVDWAHPSRWAIPFWIEAEKFWFWTLVFSLVVFIEGRRSHEGYLFTLRLMLALQVTGMAIWSGPFSPPLPEFHQEAAQWFLGGTAERLGYFFKVYPRMQYYYNAAYMWLHPPMLFIAYATLAGTFAASLFSFRDQDASLDRSAYEYAKAGYLLLTLGMLVGYPWAIVAWGPNWWWDPKIASSILMWLLYSAYLHHRFVMGSRHGRWQVAALGVLCFISLIFTYFMSWYFPGEHTF